MDLASVTQTAPGPATPGPRPGVSQELRLALAMRGGVSLAVWIGGAVAEIERLRRSGTGEAVHPVYRALLGLGRYSTVTIDVLAGASAGGLNAAVYAAAQCHGFDVAEMRPLWMALGDIEASSRATTSAGRAAESPGAQERDALRPPSLLDGDGYFFPEMARRLESFIATGRKAVADQRRQPVGQVDLLLSATLFQPRDIELLLNRHNRVRETGAEALFRFRRAPGRDDFDVEDSIRPLAEALAMAARSTSSFPVAFEPARISVGTGQAPDFGNTFELPGGRPVGDVAVIDGGTLDNIPVAAALRAIVDSPAGGPTERWLLYLNPSPPEPEAAGSGGDAEEGLNSPGAVATVVRTLTTRFGVESLLTDVRELETVNEAARRRRLTMAAAFAGIRTDGEELVAEIAEAVDDRTAELAEIWLNLDVSAVIRALRRPAAGDAVRAHLEEAPLARWTDEDELALAPALQAVLTPRPVDGTGPATMWRSPAWMAELTRLLISWARSIEHRVDDPTDIGGVKAHAYRLRALAGALEQAQRQQWLAAAPHYDAATMTVDGWAAQTCNEMLRRVPDAFARRIPAALIWSDALEDLLADLDFTLGEHGDHDLGEAIWWAACRVAARLQKIGARAAGQDPGQAGWEIFRHLETLAGPDQLRAGLAGLVTLSAPLALLGPAPDSEIRFAQLTGRAPTPLHWRFSTLKEQRLRQPGAPGRSAPLRPADKLCGDELANFSAFLSAKWRANDWMWGRLDAASTVVDNLLDPDRLARQHDGETTRLLDRLEDALAATPNGWAFEGLPKPARRRLEQGPGDDPEQWEEWVAAVTEVRDCVVERLHWEILAAEVPTVNGAGHDPREVRPPPAKPAGFEETKSALADYDVGLQGLADLGDKRRVRMFLRAALVAFGTLRPDGESVSAVAGRWAATALKPLYLIAVFVAASLRRGLFVAAIALASIQMTYWRAEDLLHLPGLFSITGAIAGAALVFLLSSVPARNARLRVAGLALAALAVLFTLWD
ncbi:MAG: patatin-like protein, partial [Acidimicrobiia bacterium]